MGMDMKKLPIPKWNGSFVYSAELFAQEFLDAVGADIFALEVDHVLGVVAENTGGLIFLQDDRGAVHVDLKGVLLGNIQGATELDWENNPPQFIHLSHNSSRFHSFFSFRRLKLVSVFFHYYLETDIIITQSIPKSMRKWKITTCSQEVHDFPMLRIKNNFKSIFTKRDMFSKD